MSTVLDELLKKMVETGASDLHLKAGSPPVVRIDGELQITRLPTLTPGDTVSYAESIFTSKAAQSFRETSEANFAYGRREFGRFRVNVFRQRNSVSLVLRKVRHHLSSLDDLGLPQVLSELKLLRSGLVIVAGPSSSGKTTTLASLIDDINRNMAVNIMTVEDPIEVVHADLKSIVSQREIGIDTKSYTSALEHMLRQDPDVILVDQMNDAATVKAVLQAAEMGHLVFAGLPTVDATESVTRLIDYFPEPNQKQVRAQLAGQLRAVICQRLLDRADGDGLASAVELLQTSSAVRRIVESDSIAELPDVIALAYPRMQTYDQSIEQLFNEEVITHGTAMAAASDRDGMYARIGHAPGAGAVVDEVSEPVVATSVAPDHTAAVVPLVSTPVSEPIARPSSVSVEVLAPPVGQRVPATIPPHPSQLPPPPVLAAQLETEPPAADDDSVSVVAISF